MIDKAEKPKLTLAITCYEKECSVEISSELDDHVDVIHVLSSAFTTEALDNPLFLCVLLSATHNALLEKPGIAKTFCDDLKESLVKIKELQNNAEGSSNLKLIKIGFIDSKNDEIELEEAIEYTTH